MTIVSRFYLGTILIGEIAKCTDPRGVMATTYKLFPSGHLTDHTKLHYGEAVQLLRSMLPPECLEYLRVEMS